MLQDNNLYYGNESTFQRGNYPIDQKWYLDDITKKEFACGKVLILSSYIIHELGVVMKMTPCNFVQ